MQPASRPDVGAAADFVVPYGAVNASVRVRVVEWLDRLEPQRATIWGPGHRRGRPPADGTTVLLRNRARFSRGRREARLLRAATLGVYELDDGLPWDDGTLPDLGRWWKRPFPRSLIASRAAAAADRIIAGNDVLADWATAHCDDVRVIPTCVDPTRYRRRDPADSDDEFVVGWIGSPATQHYLEDITAAIRSVAARRAVRLEVIGAVESALPAELSDLTTVVPWSEGVETTRLATWSVGVMPLRDGPYERAKCGYKLLQYAAAGIPAIGSPVGVNRSILDSLSAPAPTNDDEWIDALLGVASASSSDRMMWSRASAATADAYSFAAWQERWMAATGLGPEVAA